MNGKGNLFDSKHLSPDGLSPKAQLVKNPPASYRRLKRCGFNPWAREDPLEQEMATHSRNLAWKIPWKRSWAATVHGGPKESDMIEHTHTYLNQVFFLCALIFKIILFKYS